MEIVWMFLYLFLAVFDFVSAVGAANDVRINLLQAKPNGIEVENGNWFLAGISFGDQYQSQTSEKHEVKYQNDIKKRDTVQILNKCGRGLKEYLRLHCSNNFYSGFPNRTKRSSETGNEGTRTKVVPRRTKTITEECCLTSCHITQLNKYCN